MVKLAKWGAMAGLGKGIVQNAETAIKREDDVLEEQRNQRLENLRNKNAIARDKVRATEDRKNTELEITGREDLQGQQIEATATEGVKKREGNMAVQKERSRGALETAKVSASVRKKDKRWEKIVKPGGTKFTPEGQEDYPPEVSVYDTKTQKTFTQKDNIFIPQGVNIDEVKMPDNPDYIQNLIDNPEAVDQFLSRYKFLPAEFMDQF